MIVEQLGQQHGPLQAQWAACVERGSEKRHCLVQIPRPHRTLGIQPMDRCLPERKVSGLELGLARQDFPGGFGAMSGSTTQTLTASSEISSPSSASRSARADFGL